MLTVIIYDIEETNNRNHLIKKLRHFGLNRIQKSVFSGYLDKSSRKKLQEYTKENIQSDKDSIIHLEICHSCQKTIIIQGENRLPSEDNKEYGVLL
ncbi:MAG: CRISPR-associated endonuclease Cas2 [Methanosphaera sp.]|nr:CRISPR-associated endonuclease Cas2 [Methanosphaera sp.]